MHVVVIQAGKHSLAADVEHGIISPSGKVVTYLGGPRTNSDIDHPVG
ncbi:hypothetical protein [Mycobacterium leprae]|nr:hypothetical protein [Mycobacterium leprae]